MAEGRITVAKTGMTTTVAIGISSLNARHKTISRNKGGTIISHSDRLKTKITTGTNRHVETIMVADKTDHRKTITTIGTGSNRLVETIMVVGSNKTGRRKSMINQRSR